jgi:predicted GNAT family acetyltransferase
MAEIKFELDKSNRGAFKLYDESGFAGEMAVSLNGNKLTVYHTEVKPEAAGKGYAKQLLEAMVAYVRQSKLMVIPLCPFVHAQFKRHSEMYADVWDGKMV